MMVLMGTETSVRSAASYVDTQVGEPEQTTFEIRGDAAEAIREDATGITATATIGGTATTPAAATINDDGTVTITGITVAEALNVRDTGILSVDGQGTYAVQNTNILNAIAGGLSLGSGITITQTTVGGTAYTGTVTLDANARTWTLDPAPINNGLEIVIHVNIDSYVTGGVPIGNQAARTVVFTYAIPAFTREVENIYPADRCTWQQEDSVTGRGYFIRGARFFNGMDATGFDIHNAQFGYIGKSGRFVAITNRA